MGQESRTKIKAGTLALLGAAALAIVSIAYAARRDASDEAAGAGNTVEATGPAASAPPADPEAVIRALQDEAGANPRDPAGWRKLGEAYFLAERYEDATRAWRRAAGLAPEDAASWSAYGEAAVMASRSDPMPDEALVAFRKARQLDPKDARARYFLAVARDLSGDHAGAIDDWFALLADTQPDAPYAADVRRTIEQVARINGIDLGDRLSAIPTPATAPMASPGGDPVATGGIPGPSAEQLAAASSIPPSAQKEMAAGMVARLEAKLKAAPANVDGWIMLMRSHMALGDAAKAAAARDAAIAANPAAAARIRTAADTLAVPRR